MKPRSRRAPVKIVHVTLGLDVGGQEKLLVEFARHANRTQFALHFVSLTTRGSLAAEIETLGWPVTTLDASPGLRPGLIGKLYQTFRRLGANVVHTHDDRPQIYGALAGWLAGARVIHTRHSQGVLLSPRQRLLVRLSANFTDRFVCISRDSSQRAAQQGIPRRRIRTIWNGIDTARFAPGTPDPTGPAVIVARLAPEKDIETLLAAVARVAAVRPGFRLEIAGDGRSQAELVRLSGSLNLGEHVRFLGAVRDVPAFLGRARLFVLSSVTEGISLTLLEAMARGLPVAATRVGGNVEVVEEGVTGLLVPPRDPDGLAVALLRIWDDADLARRLGQAGRQRVERHFDVRRMVADYERLYDPVPDPSE